MLWVIVNIISNPVTAEKTKTKIGVADRESSIYFWTTTYS